MNIYIPSRIFLGDLAIDLGTANTLVYTRRGGLVFNEPTVVAMTRNDTVLAAGAKAKQMLGRAPVNIEPCRPMQRGRITSIKATTFLLRHFVAQVKKKEKAFFRGRPKIIVGVPVIATNVELRALKEALQKAGAKEVVIVEQPTAAAIGLGHQVDTSSVMLVIDIGGGTTQVSIISMNGVIYSCAIPKGGDDLTEDIQRYFTRKQFTLGVHMAEDIKIKIGSALPLENELTFEAKGLDSFITAGGRKTPGGRDITSQEVREALKGTLGEIIGMIKGGLRYCDGEVHNDIIDQGARLVGGSGKLRLLDQYISQEISGCQTDQEVNSKTVSHQPIKVHTPEDPFITVVEGLGQMLFMPRTQLREMEIREGTARRFEKQVL